MAKKPPKQGSNRTGTKNSPSAGKPGFKPRIIDWERIGELASIQCTTKEICAVEKISYEWLDTLCERDNGIKLGDFIDQNKKRGHESLRRAQYKNAIDNGNVQMQIFLGKNWLNQSDKQEFSGKFTHEITHESLLARIEERNKLKIIEADDGSN